jgi:hypothetical protein
LFLKFSVLQNLADRQLKTRYVVATDSSKDSLIRITRKVSQTLGTGRVKAVVDQENSLLTRDITVNSFILLAFKDKQNIF